MHNEGLSHLEIEYVFLDEFLLINTAHVLFFLNAATRVAWRRAGSLALTMGSRNLAILVGHDRRTLAYLVAYIPPSAAPAAERVEEYQRLAELFGKVQEHTHRIVFCCDWNAHTCLDVTNIDDKCFGRLFLDTPSTTPGRSVAQRIQDHDLCDVGEGRHFSFCSIYGAGFVSITNDCRESSGRNRQTTWMRGISK